ncbi:MAG TPA: AMIN domain-containing protein [Desulfuromonadaceae bacterium]|jgi:hypothetical protein
MKQSIMMRALFLVAGWILLMAAVPASAAVKDCAYKKTLQQGSYIFDISSRPADGCAVQIVEVVIRRGAKPIAHFKTDVDYLVETAWIVDLNKDGKPELAVASRSVKSGGRGTFDVYWLDGNIIRRAAMQEHEEGIGYQGHDAFRLQGRSIARSFPVYLENDPENRPSGSMRTLQYEFNKGKLELNLKLDSAIAAAAVPIPPVQPVAAAQPERNKKQAPPVALVSAEPASPAPLEIKNQVIAKPVNDETANVPVKAEAEVLKTAPESAIPQAVEPAVTMAAAPEKLISAEPAPMIAKETRKSVASVNKSIVRKIAVGAGFIEIQSTEPVLNYKIIKLDKPARIAIDIPGAQSGIATKSVAIGRHGISKARIGTSSGTLRVVLDSLRAAVFPPYSVTTADNNLRIDFTTAVSTTVAPPAAEQSTAAVAIEPKAAQTRSVKATKASSKPIITDIVGGADFIDIMAGGPIVKFKLIKLTEPTRLAIDIPLASSALARKTIAIGNGGIEKARIGNGPTYLRIVLDSSLPELPAHKVITTETGLRIELKK